MDVSRIRWICAGVVLAIVLGCGGGGGNSGTGAISGNVADLNGNPVRNAKVFAINKVDKYTLTNSSGAFLLQNVSEGDPTVAAEVVINGLSFYGQNTLRVFKGEQSKSMQITVGRRDQMGRLKGKVTDRFGDSVEGARVFANNGSLGSVVAVTNRSGDFDMFLHPGYDYSILAGGAGYDSDSDVIRLSISQTRNQNFVLSNPRDVGFAPPANFSAVAWTSPKESTRSPKEAQAYEAIKRAIDPRRARTPRDRRPTPKNTVGGNWIESDLYWDPITNVSLLGYGIYRGTSATGATQAIEFLRDPMAGFFADFDQGLREGVAYFYEITALNVNYPDTFNSESDFSDRWGIMPLGDCTLRNVSAGSPVRFNWNATSGAEKYTVFVFPDYPDYGVDPIWPVNSGQMADATTTGTSLNYGGPLLGTGTYYYVVLAQDYRNGNDARSISRIGSFVVN